MSSSVTFLSTIRCLTWSGLPSLGPHSFRSAWISSKTSIALFCRAVFTHRPHLLGPALKIL